MSFKFLNIFIYLSSIFFSSCAYSAWEKVGKNNVEDTLYIDFQIIRKSNNYVFWEMLKDQSNSILIAGIEYNSIKFNMKNDCKLNRIKFISFTIYKKSMGKGTGETTNFPKDYNWIDPASKPMFKKYFQQVCNYKSNSNDN